MLHHYFATTLRLFPPVLVAVQPVLHLMVDLWFLGL